MVSEIVGGVDWITVGAYTYGVLVLIGALLIFVANERFSKVGRLIGPWLFPLIIVLMLMLGTTLMILHVIAPALDIIAKIIFRDYHLKFINRGRSRGRK